MWWESPSSGSRNTGKQFQFDGYQYDLNLQIVLASQNIRLWERKIILSTIWYKKNKRLAQAGNDKTENIREHTCKKKWNGLQCRNMLKNKFCQHGQSKSTHQEQSTRKIESEATNTVLLWIHQALTNYLKVFICEGILLKGQKLDLGMGLYQADTNKAA